jgi:1-deoxy-D-xylulose-5-phosphate reductoisomerase
VAEVLMRRLVILGSTGSIGRAAMDVVRRLRSEIEVVGLASYANVSLLADQVREVHPAAVAVGSEEAREAFRAALPEWRGKVLAGPDGLTSLASEIPADLVLVSVVGIAGLRPTLAALQAGRDVALATKEVLVAGGALVMAEAKRRGVRLLPVDSEPSGIFQCLAGRAPEDITRIWLTASGGPFLRTPAAGLEAVSPAEALRHPTWKMGRKVTVDSATLMNKGLEVIEAHWLFGLPPDQIEVVIHPQSLVHACVEFVDGSLLAHLGPADMRGPIQFALTYPRRLAAPPARLDLRTLGELAFEPPDGARFPCLGLAREALVRGGTVPAALNAANEVAVQLFLDGRIGFSDIGRLVRGALDRHRPVPAISLETVLAADRDARRDVEEAALPRDAIRDPRTPAGAGTGTASPQTIGGGS